MHLIDTLEIRTVKTDTCWVWTGGTDKFGYGTILERDCSGGPSTLHMTHRLSYEHYVGDIPKGLCVLHKCDNPSCVRPDHLFLGTRADNIRDMIKKGRAVHRSNPIRLKMSQVKDIRAEYAEGKTSHVKLATKYGVCAPTISNILSKKTYRDV